MKLGSRIQAYTKHALFMQSIIRFTSYVEQSISNCSMQQIQIFILQSSFRKTQKNIGSSKEINYIHSIQIYCMPMELDKFLMNDEYTFVGFAIEGDKSKPKVSGLEINSDNYIDIQVEWRDPYNKKEFESLADVASRMIDIHYHDMKKKINRKEDHTLWGFCPLPEKLIKYAAIDAFATYESWRIIYDVIMGLDRAKRDKEEKKKKKKVVIQDFVVALL